MSGSDAMRSVTDKRQIRILKQVNKRLTHDLQEIADISRKQLEWAEQNRMTPGKRMTQIMGIAEGSLLYLDCRASDIMELSRDVPKSQMKLRGTDP